MKQKGFTLVELIVVLAILAVLSAIMVPSLTGYIDKAKNTQLLSIARSVYTAAQIEVSEAYARGEIEVKAEGNDRPAEGNFPSIRNIVENSEIKDWGFAGQDYVDYKEGNKVKYFINGFGFSQKKDAKYHFKILVSKDGKIEELSICQGDRIATLKDGEFEVSSFKCKDAHNGNNLFNFVFINLDRNHKARYEKVFYSLVRYD